MRLDQYIAQNFKLSRNRAQMLVKNGLVQVNSSVIRVSNYQIKKGDQVEILKNDLSDYVSRSALKLKYFLEDHPEILINGKVCLDVGASTGGFTQILLENGAFKVYAVDVGSDQLHESLKGDSRIVSMEKCDIRDMNGFEDDIDLITVDVSFISLEKVIPPILKLAPKVTYIFLFKPQFEVGKGNLTKSGVVKDDKITQKSLKSFIDWLTEIGLEVKAYEPSKLAGEEGNQEYLILI